MAAGSRPFWRFLSAATLVALSVGSVPSVVAAQQNPSKISVATGADFSHAYFFRGIVQERSGVVAQPFFEVSFNLFEGTEGLNNVSLTVGQWNSLHSGPSGSDGPSANVGAWYESDFYTGVSFGVDNWDFGVTYTAYRSPNDSFGTVKELALNFAFDDSAWLGTLALSPHIAMAVELDSQRDGGGGEGVYVEFGVEPAIPLGESPIGLTVPVTLGISLSDYYEETPGNDSGFGFADIGVVAIMPLPIDESYGAWEVNGGLHLMTLGVALTAFNGGDGLQAVGTFGFSLGY
jgi:hypothetical protein